MTGVLVVMLDDARADLLRYMPFTSGTLRPAGTQFTNMRCNVPACDPARAGFLTGQWARGAANGVYENDQSDITAATVDSLPVWLGDAGVTTGLFGKYIQSTHTVWDERRILTTNGYEAYGYTIDNNGSDITPAAHQLTYTAGELSTFIAAQAGDWFAWWAPTNPHINVNAFLGCNPLPSTVPKFAWKRWVFTLLTDTTGKPSWISSLAQFSQSDLTAIREVARQQIRECYDVDQALATICAGIDFDTTTVIVCSDSGVFYGEQRLGSVFGASKDQPYDVVAKVPCVLRGPGIPVGTNTTPTTLQDITATVCDILGATPTVAQDGVSLLDLIATPDPTRATLYERQGDATYPDGEGAVTETMKLLHWPGETGTDEWEAYDLDTDPDEHLNWANDAGRAADLAAMQAVLAGL